MQKQAMGYWKFLANNDNVRLEDGCRALKAVVCAVFVFELKNRPFFLMLKAKNGQLNGEVKMDHSRPDYLQHTA